MTNEEIKQEIETAEAHIDKLEKKLLGSKKLELKYELYCYNLHITANTPEKGIKVEGWRTHGATRATKELAEIATKNMVTRNKLEAWVHERQGDGEGYWRIQISEGYYKAVSWDSMSKIIGAVYMKKETAEWICERLNDGRISLNKNETS